MYMYMYSMLMMLICQLFDRMDQKCVRSFVRSLVSSFLHAIVSRERIMTNLRLKSFATLKGLEKCRTRTPSHPSSLFSLIVIVILVMRATILQRPINDNYYSITGTNSLSSILTVYCSTMNRENALLIIIIRSIIIS
jgi:hypothetical protein